MKRFLLAILPAIALLSACDKSDTATTIQFDTPGNLQIPFTSGIDSVFYTISHPVSGGTVDANANESWITDFDTSVDGILYFTVEENHEKEIRSAILTLTYTYAGGNTSAQINVIQDASNAIVFEASYAGGFYYGDLYSEGMRYYTWLTENPLQGNGLGTGINYCFDIYADEPENMGRIAAEPGTYTFDSSTSTAAGTFGARESRMVDGSNGNTTYFKEGTLTITREGDEYHYFAELKDSTGQVHRISYTGNVSLINTSSPYVSTLTDDYELELDGAELYAYYFGQYYGASTNNWSGTLVPAGGNGDAFQFDLCAPLAFDFEAGFPTGTFAINDSLEENTSLNGFNDITNANVGTWYFEWSNYEKTNKVAPLISGNIKISKEGDMYTMSLIGEDDAGNRITASWSGEANCTDQTGNAAPAPSALPLR